MQTKRIEYIDALRGFTMYLVVFSHIWTFGYHVEEKPDTFATVLTNFFLVLFFFISGFVAYKKDRSWALPDAARLLKNKAIQLLTPSIFFCALFCWWKGYGIDGALAPANAGYWFTIHLFYFFVFYSLTNILMPKRLGGVKIDVLLLLVAFIIFAISYSHVQIERTQIGADLFHYLGMKNWRYYIFFIVGVLVRKHFNGFVQLTDNKYAMALSILGFFGMVFYADHIDFPMWKPLNMLIYGMLSIIVIFTFFRKYETSFQSSTKLGYSMQYIGRRTMDIYMIHYFLLPRNMDFVGQFFANNVNPSLEFFVTSIIALLVILLSLIMGNVIRLSPLLAHYLLGAKKA